MTPISRRYAHALKQHTKQKQPHGSNRGGKNSADVKLRRQIEDRERGPSHSPGLPWYLDMSPHVPLIPSVWRPEALFGLINLLFRTFSQCGAVTAVVPGRVWHRRKRTLFFFFCCVLLEAPGWAEPHVITAKMHLGGRRRCSHLYGQMWCF